MNWTIWLLLYVTEILISYILHKTRHSKLGSRLIVYFSFQELDDVNVTMFRLYFIFRQIALLEEWKSIGFASQCLHSTFLVVKTERRPVSCKTWKSHEFLQCDRYVTSPYYSFHTNVTGIALSGDWKSYIC